MQEKKIAVAFFQRRPRAVGNYSIEFIFDDLRKRLRDKIDITTIYSSYESSGFFKRLYNCLEAWRNQQQVNHVTGDIHYVGFFLSPQKTIHTIHDIIFMTGPRGLRHSVLKYFWLTLPVKRSRFIVVVSEATKAEILKYINCDPDKIIVIPVPISAQYVPQHKTFNKENPVVLQIGAAHNKNIPRLIEALKNLNCILHIIGAQNDEYEKLLQQANIKYKYQWGLTDEEMRGEYANADIITLVSTYEGFGMPILEAQATGRPVITSNILSMPFVAGDAACLVDPQNIEDIRAGFIKIIHDDAYRTQLIEKGFNNVKRFNPDSIAEQYFALYQKTAQQ